MNETISLHLLMPLIDCSIVDSTVGNLSSSPEFHLIFPNMDTILKSHVPNLLSISELSLTIASSLINRAKDMPQLSPLVMSSTMFTKLLKRMRGNVSPL